MQEERRHGISSINDEYDGGNEDDGIDPYYTLPPSRTEIMQDWNKWRTLVNELMIDSTLKPNDFSTKREILTSSGISKTPDFFLGKNAIHGNRVKDEYGGEAITETDDGETKVRKKIMEENFYLFGIPRLSVRRCSSEVGSVISQSFGSRRSSVADTNFGVDSSPSHTFEDTRRGSCQSFNGSSGSSASSNVEGGKPSPRHYSFGSKSSSKLGFFKKKFRKASQPNLPPPLPARRRFSTGNI